MSENIILDYIGGVNFIRGKIENICRSRLYTPPFFRGDTIEYMTLTAQIHLKSILTKALDVAKHRCRDGDSNLPPGVNALIIDGDSDLPPEVNADDLRLVRMMIEEHVPFLNIISIVRMEDYKIDYNWGEDLHEVTAFCTCTECTKVRRFVRAIAFQVGIVNVNDDLFDCVLGEMMYCIGALVLGILKQYVDNDLDIWFGSDIEENDLGALNVGFGDIRMECSPPFKTNDEDLDNHTRTIVPGQIKAIALGVGMKPLLGFEEFGSSGWATSQGNTKEQEMEAAINEYRRSELYQEDEIMYDAANESDADFVVESNSEGEGSDHELDPSFVGV